MPLDAWWIIILPDTGLNFRQTVKPDLERNLCRWSTLSGFMASETKPRWWCIDDPRLERPTDCGALVESLRAIIRNPFRDKDGSGNHLGGDIRADRLNIAIVGNIVEDIPRSYLHTLGRMLRHSQEELFPEASLNIYGLAFLSAEPPDDGSKPETLKFFSELATMMADPVAASRPFDNFFIVQEQNNVSENKTGYVRLKPKEISGLVSQALLHLMIGENEVLEETRHQYMAQYLSIGSVGVFYDVEQHRQALGMKLSGVLLDKFKNSSQSPFVNDKLARGILEEIVRRFSIEALFQKLTLAEEKPSFMFNARIWEGAKDQDGRPVSHWAMHKPELLYVYFLRYLRNLPLRLTEYTRIYLTLSMQKYRDYLKKRKTTVFLGNVNERETGLKEMVTGIVKGILKGDHGAARSLGQVRLFVSLLKTAFDPAGLKNTMLNIEAFRNLQVFQVPDFLKEFYDSAPERLDPETEEKIYKKITDTIRSHPIPTALLVRTLLFSVLAVFTGFYVARLLSPNIIDLQWLLDSPGLATAVLCLIPFAFAYWRYKIRTLNALWREIKRYVASVLKHTQNKAKDLVVTAMGEVYDDVRKLCDDIDGHCRILQDRLACKGGTEKNGYVASRFLFPVFGETTVPGREQKIRIFEKEPDFPLGSAAIDKPLGQLNDDEINRLLGAMLDEAKTPQPEEKTFSGLLSDTMLQDMGPETFEGIDTALTRFCEDQYDSIPASLHTLLERYVRPSSHQAEQFDNLSALAFSPIVPSTGAQRQGTVFEAKSAENGIQTIRQYFPWTKSNGTPGDSLLSIAGFQPIQRLEDIASIYALRTGVTRETIDWNDAPAILTRAFTQGDSGGIRWLYDQGIVVEMTQEALQQADNLRKDLFPGDTKDEGCQEEF